MTAEAAFGCSVCWPESAEGAWSASRELEREHTLVDEPHYTLRILRCADCGQQFLRVFTELIDWQGGGDSFGRVVIPVTVEEAADLVAGRYSEKNRSIYDIGNERPSVWMISPQGGESYTRRGTGIPFLPHD